MENSNYCPQNQETNSNCCPETPPHETDKKGMKKKIGIFLLGLAFIVGLSSVFKISTNLASCNPTECSASKTCTPTQKAACGVAKIN